MWRASSSRLKGVHTLGRLEEKVLYTERKIVKRNEIESKLEDKQGKKQVSKDQDTTTVGLLKKNKD